MWKFTERRWAEDTRGGQTTRIAMTVIVVMVLMVDMKIWKEFQRLLHQSVGLWDTDMSPPPNALKTEMPNENISSSDSTSPHNNDYETDASITSRTEKRTCWKATTKQQTKSTTTVCYTTSQSQARAQAQDKLLTHLSHQSHNASRQPQLRSQQNYLNF